MYFHECLTVWKKEDILLGQQTTDLGQEKYLLHRH